MKAPMPTEDQEQYTVVEWLELHDVCYFHVPNGEARTARTDIRGRRFSPAGQRLKKLGTKAGVPDLVIIDAPPADPLSRGTVIEMKRRKGKKPTEAQNGWLDAFHDRNWRRRVCYGAGEAIAFLTELGYGRRKR